jgi:protein TonB
MAAVHGGTVPAHGLTDRTFAYAVAGSLLVHALILLALHGVTRPTKNKPVSAPILARLVPAQVLAPALPPQPERPPRTEPAALPKQPAPRLQPAPPRRVAPPALVPLVPSPAPATPSATETQRSPEKAIEVLQPTPPAPPSMAAPPVTPEIPRPPSPPAPAEQADPATLGQYRMAIISAAKRYKRYPRVAIDNNWEGLAEIRMVIGPDGSIASIGIRTRSGYEVLDQQALEMIRKAKPLTPIPAALRGKGFSIDIPVIFSLKEETG